MTTDPTPPDRTAIQWAFDTIAAMDDYHSYCASQGEDMWDCTCGAHGYMDTLAELLRRADEPRVLEGLRVETWGAHVFQPGASAPNQCLWTNGRWSACKAPADAWCHVPLPAPRPPTVADGICDCGEAHRWDVDRQEFVPTHTTASRPPEPDRTAALEAICAAHHADPDGGMGYLPEGGYGHYEYACVVCGTSDEYAVQWPCWTWQTAHAALAEPAPVAGGTEP